MKNKKKNKVLPKNTVITGVFKKVFWPWLFIIAAAAISAYTYAHLLIEFFGDAKICADTCCNDFFSYTFHYTPQIDKLWIVVAGLVVVAILARILFVRKRKLIVTTDAITYKKGGKVYKIPYSSIQSVTAKRARLTLKVPFKKIKIKRLKNAAAICDTINTLLQPFAEAEANQTAASKQPKCISELPYTVGIKLPVSAQSKVIYFQNLLATKMITPEQYEEYTQKVLAADFAPAEEEK